MAVSENAGRANRPDLKELVSHLDDLKELLEEKVYSLEKLASERDMRYMQMFKAIEEKTSLALAGSEKAVGKAEMATEKRFDAVNEFRGQLKDQAATLMPREEAIVKLRGIEDKVEEVKKDIVALREFRSGSGGKDEQKQTSSHMFFSMLSAIGTLIAMALALAAFFRK
jgi:hypothetical protein